MSDSRKTKRSASCSGSGAKHRHRDTGNSNSSNSNGTAKSSGTRTASGSHSSTSARRSRQGSKKTQRGSMAAASCRHEAAPLVALPAAAEEQEQEQDICDSAAVSVIDSSSLISLCSPFVVPDCSHRLVPDRHAGNAGVDLSVIYGPLDGKPLSPAPAVSDYHVLTRQKLLSTLLDNLCLIEDDASSFALSIDSTGLAAAVAATDSSDSDYDSNTDSDIDLIDEAILSAHENQTVLVPPIFDKPGADLNEVRINNTPLF